eukprot:2462244-Heterocapsa_arctica.AAC.1
MGGLHTRKTTDGEGRGEVHPLNSYGVVPGPQQSAGRAELYAAVEVLERTASDVFMIIDNKACVHNMMALIDG